MAPLCWCILQWLIMAKQGSITLAASHAHCSPVLVCEGVVVSDDALEPASLFRPVAPHFAQDHSLHACFQVGCTATLQQATAGGKVRGLICACALLAHGNRAAAAWIRQRTRLASSTSCVAWFRPRTQELVRCQLVTGQCLVMAMQAGRMNSSQLYSVTIWSMQCMQQQAAHLGLLAKLGSCWCCFCCSVCLPVGLGGAAHAPWRSHAPQHTVILHCELWEGVEAPAHRQQAQSVWLPDIISGRMSQL
jgi:hypothetical protein